jgi:hypothetical protein
MDDVRSVAIGHSVLAQSSALQQLGTLHSAGSYKKETYCIPDMTIDLGEPSVLL